MKIHPNRQAAINALKKYQQQTTELENELGIWVECDDSCCNIYIITEYYDEKGEILSISNYDY